jgi:hypothetical protein
MYNQNIKQCVYAISHPLDKGVVSLGEKKIISYPASRVTQAIRRFSRKIVFHC